MKKLIITVLVASVFAQASYKAEWEVEVSGPKKESYANPEAVAFLEAAKVGNIPKLKNLLERGVDVNSRGQGGQTALNRAASSGSVQAVGFLLSKGANPNIADTMKIGKMTPLLAALKHFPTYNNKPAVEQIVNMLLEKGVNPDVQNADGQTALMLAAASDLENVVRMLLKRGANVEIKTPGQRGIGGKKAINFAAPNSKIHDMLEKAELEAGWEVVEPN